MSLFEVKWEEDGKTVKAPGVSQTEIKVCSHWYVARDIDQVWEAIADIRHDPEGRRRLLSIAEAVVGITILDDREPPEGKRDGT
jgi:hypothetical protein